MHRRRFLVKVVSTTIVAPALGCPRDADARVVFRSSRVDGHEHLLTVREDVFFVPPRVGLTRFTNVVRGHEHIVVLGQDQLRRIGDGEVVTRATSEAEGHVHLFEFSLFDEPPLTTTGTTIPVGPPVTTEVPIGPPTTTTTSGSTTGDTDRSR